MEDVNTWLEALVLQRHLVSQLTKAQAAINLRIHGNEDEHPFFSSKTTMF